MFFIEYVFYIYLCLCFLLSFLLFPDQSERLHDTEI